MRFNKGDILTIKNNDKDYEVICCDEDIAVLAHTFLRLDETRTTNFKDISVYSNNENVFMQDYFIIFKENKNS